MTERWKIFVGVAPANGPRDARRSEWRQCATRPSEPTPEDLTTILRRHNATEIRATSPDGRIEIIWMRSWRARRTFLLTDSPESG